MRYNSVAVVPVRSLEVGDLIARELVGTIVSGKVTGIAHYGYQLTVEQLAYMQANDLTIPKGEYEPVAGESSALLFGIFTGEGLNQDQPGHMYIGLDVNVAVFPVRE